MNESISNEKWEKVYLLFSLVNTKYFNHIKDDYFESDLIKVIYKLSKKYFFAKQKVPTKQLIKILMSSVIKSNRITSVDLTEYTIEEVDEYIEVLFEKSIDEYTLDDDDILPRLQAWIKSCEFKSSFEDAIEYIQETEVTIQNIDDIIQHTKEIINERNAINFEESKGSDFEDFCNRKPLENDVIKSKYKFINKFIGGVSKKTLTSYLAPPNTGKSLFMIEDAVHFVHTGYNVLYVTLEMSEQKILKRFDCSLMDISIKQYEEIIKLDVESVNKELSKRHSRYLKKRQKSGSIFNKVNNSCGKLKVLELPTACGTTIDIENYIKDRKNEGIIFDVVIVDYIGIMKDSRSLITSENSYIKIKNIAEDLRAMAIRQNVAVITASQTNRNAFGSDDISLSDTAESSGLVATCDTMFGIIQTEEMHELENIYHLKFLRVRDGSGKNKKILINVNYDFMQLTEDSLLEY